MDIEAIKRAIQDIRPMLMADGGDIEFVSCSEDGKVRVRMTGACGSCPYSLMTIKQTVETYLKKQVPTVTEVIQA